MKRGSQISRFTFHLLGLLIVSILLTTNGCDILSQEETDSINDGMDIPKYHIEAPVDLLTISFKEPIIEMSDPTDTVGLDSFSIKANHLRNWFREVDEGLLITRYMPEFHPSDTLRVNARGDTVRSYNWALVFDFHLTKHVPFYDVKEELEFDSLIEWVDPPVSTEPADN